jgi:hypothetical protein
MKPLLFIIFFGRFVAAGGDNGGSIAQTPTLPAWTPYKSETCPAQTTITKTQVTTIYTGSVKVLTDTTTKRTTVPSLIPCDSCTTTITIRTTTTTTTTLSPSIRTYTSTVCCNQTCNTAQYDTILSGVIYRRSEAYGQLQVIQSHTVYALPILILLIVLGVLTLLALAWLIWAGWPKWKKGTCPVCRRNVSECMCGT